MNLDNEKVEYWLNMCDYDLATAKAMFEAQRYLYVGFMCHLVAEKAIKAYIFSLPNLQVPYIHSLKRLLALTGLCLKEKQLNFLSFVDPLNIKARYSSYKDDIATTLSKEVCSELINETEDFLDWIREKL